MKTLAKLILITGIGLSSLSYSYSQETSQGNEIPSIKTETNSNKYIPEWAKNVKERPFDTGYGLVIAYWWDKNKDGKPERDEMFFDINGDGIIDMDFPEIKAYISSRWGWKKGNELDDSEVEDIKRI
jgi:hypothetical protein